MRNSRFNNYIITLKEKIHNIDFTTFAGNTTYVNMTGTKSVGNTWTDFDSWTVPATGLYCIRLGMSCNSGSTKSASDAKVTINGNDSTLTLSRFSFTAWSGNNFVQGTATECIWLAKDDVLKIRGKNQNYTGNLNVYAHIQRVY